MGKFYGKALLLVLMACFCIFFGVDLASRGMGRIQGPVLPGTAASLHSADSLTVPAQGQKAVSSGSSVKQTAAAGALAGIQVDKRHSPDPAPAIQDQDLNYIGNKLGDLLQIVAHHSINFVVSLLSSIIG